MHSRAYRQSFVVSLFRFLVFLLLFHVTVVSNIQKKLHRIFIPLKFISLLFALTNWAKIIKNAHSFHRSTFLFVLHQHHKTNGIHKRNSTNFAMNENYIGARGIFNITITFHSTKTMWWFNDEFVEIYWGSMLVYEYLTATISAQSTQLLLFCEIYIIYFEFWPNSNGISCISCKIDDKQAKGKTHHSIFTVY